MDSTQSQEPDLDRTDRLPILEGVSIDPDVADDAVCMDFGALKHNFDPVPATLDPGSAAAPPLAPVPSSALATQEFARLAGVDLPSLAESVRSVEDRIARQNAEYEALSRSYERVLDAESLAVTRANALAVDLNSARALLEGEQKRFRGMEAAIAERDALVENARARIENAVRESERHQTESRTLRDSLAARDTAISQVLHSLGERDAQLSALQREHARIVPILEDRSKTSEELEQELRIARESIAATAADLKSSREATASITAQLKRGDAELLATRSELQAMRSQANAHLELLRTRNWRQGFDHNLFREMDAERGAAAAGRSVLSAERDDLKCLVASLNAKIAELEAAIAALRAAASADAANLNDQARRLVDVDHERTNFSATVTNLNAEIARLNSEVLGRESAVHEAHSSGAAELRKLKDQLLADEKARADLAQQVINLQQQAESRDDEIAVLVAHLNEARRPIEPIEAEVRRLTEEIGAKALAVNELTEESRTLRANLDRTRGQLEEREFLIRRLERSESNSANVLGRIQTSIERLGVAPTAGPVVDMVAELVRIDGSQVVSHPLGRRTRVGRAPGCELQIDSSSVSRHHALILVGVRDVIVEDLNSTNGILVNGRRISRQLLNDGDAVVIGEVPFRLSLKPKRRDGYTYESSPRLAFPNGGAASAASHSHPPTIPDSNSAEPPMRGVPDGGSHSV